MNLFIWFGIFAVVNIVSIVIITSVDYDHGFLTVILAVILAVSLIFSIISLACGFCNIKYESELDYLKIENEIRRNQLVSYVESVEYPKALEQMYFDDVINFNRYVYHAEKYGDKWMFRWILYDPSYLGMEPIDLEELKLG